MMKRIFKGSMVYVAVMLMMTGCGNQIPELSKEEMEQVGEYAALTLLKYDTNHRSRLVDEALVEEYEKELEEKAKQEAMTPTPKPTPVGMDPVADTPVIEKTQEPVLASPISIEECLGLPTGLQIAYQGYTIETSYPKDDSAKEYFVLDAAEVLDFTVENQGTNDEKVNLFSTDSFFVITINDGESYNAQTTMLLNDLSTYVGTLEQGTSQDMVLMFEVEQEVADNISKLTLQYKKESTIDTILLD